MAVRGVSLQPPDCNPFPFSFLPGFFSHYEWFYAHMCEPYTITSNIHSPRLQTVILSLPLGSSDVDQKDGLKSF